MNSHARVLIPNSRKILLFFLMDEQILEDVIAAGERQVEEQRRELASLKAEEAGATENSAEGPPRPPGSNS
jgi:hypothetical protein